MNPLSFQHLLSVLKSHLYIDETEKHGIGLCHGSKEDKEDSSLCPLLSRI